MSIYIPPINDIRFDLTEIAGLSEIVALPGYEECSSDLVDAILDEAGKFASEVLDPINAPGDRQGAKWQADGEVKAADGFREAYDLFVDTGWNAMPFDAEFGGQGLPNVVSMAVSEMWKSANMAFALCPMLTGGAIEAIAHHGSEELKQTWLPKMVEGRWTGTMNLTEPQAGSDLAAVRTRAVPEADGRYRLSGTKIFITWGEHDMAENIVHLVLARLPDAPLGVKGISLFVVPKFLVNSDGSLGARNDLICASIEHKMGIHGSPTAVMAFGEKDGAIGYLVGDAHKGLGYMFTMMNHARINVGLEGVGISERAYQHALSYARERVQGTPIGEKRSDKLPILHHPDVRRMLMDMKARTEAMRALAYYVAGQLDRAHHHDDAVAQTRHQARVDFLTPVVKGWSTEQGIELTSTGIQIHGGVGFIEETGACQYFRDARIATIYEGTTGIQANDLIGRKLARESIPGGSARALIAEMGVCAGDLVADVHLRSIGTQLSAALEAMSDATDWLLANSATNPRGTAAGAVSYLKLVGIVSGGWLLAKSARIARTRIEAGSGDDFLQAKIVTARYFAAHQMPLARALASTIRDGSDSVLELADTLF